MGRLQWPYEARSMSYAPITAWRWHVNWSLEFFYPSKPVIPTVIWHSFSRNHPAHTQGSRFCKSCHSWPEKHYAPRGIWTVPIVLLWIWSTPGWPFWGATLMPSCWDGPRSWFIRLVIILSWKRFTVFAVSLRWFIHFFIISYFYLPLRIH